MALTQSTQRSCSSTVSVTLSPVSSSRRLRDSLPSSDWLLLVEFHFLIPPSFQVP